MRRKFLFSIPQLTIAVVLIILATTFTVLAASGTTDAPNASGLTASYTLEDIYQRLVNGTAGSQSTFNEPSVAPGTGSMHDLNDIMAAAPGAISTNGATSDEVLQGQRFWGLTNGQWGPQTGNMTSQPNVIGSDGSLSFNIPNGYYSGKTASAADANLIADNIRHGVTIFGITGNYLTGWIQKTSRGSTLVDMDMLTMTDGWAIGQTNAYHWDGSTWSTAYKLSDYVGVNTIDMVNTNDVWATGNATQFYHWDGSSWSTLGSTEAANEVFDIHMVNSNDGWAVGSGGRIYHYDGSTWSLHTTTTEGSGLHTLYMLNSSNGWAMGYLGYVYHWDGSTWTLFGDLSAATFHAIDMLNIFDGWAVGENGYIYHWNGSSWSESANLGFDADLYALDMVSSTMGWAAGSNGQVYYWDGSNWELDTNIGSSNISGLAMFNSTEGWAVNENGEIFIHRD